MSPDDALFRDEFLPLFRQLVQNACVNTGDPDSGGEDRSVATLAEFFARRGLEGKVFHARPGRGSLLVRVPGTDPKAPSLMFMGHLDVVPARAADWSVDPFSAEVKDGQVWGRGAVDMLCWTAAQAVGFAEAVARAPGGRYPGDLAFLAVADEEASGRWGARFLTENHWDEVKADYLVTELGGFFIDSDRGPAAFCTLGEKGVAWVRLATKGRAGHGSMPYRADNAAVKAAEAVRKIARRGSPLKRSPAWKAMASAMARGPWERLAFASGWTEPWALARLGKRNPGMARFLHTAGRTTWSPNLVRAGEKVNIIADRAEVLVDCRVLPGTTEADLEGALRRALGPRLSAEFTFEVLEWFPANLSGKDNPLYPAVEALFRRAHPDARLVDLVIGGVTDGRFWRSRGTTVYGFTLFSKALTMDAYGQRIHGADERIDLESLALGLGFFTDLPAVFWKNPASPPSQADES
jgi:acetylornithine deacetylase/succinyl-diaminopimelate desuccinylase-like protein